MGPTSLEEKKAAKRRYDAAYCEANRDRIRARKREKYAQSELAAERRAAKEARLSNPPQPRRRKTSVDAANLTADQLRAVLAYDPDTGQFARLAKTCNSVNAGDIAGSINAAGYRMVCAEGVQYYVHRLAFLFMTGAWPEGHVDHINGIKGDNRWANLRSVSVSVNLQNQRRARSDSTSGLIGARKKRKRWMASITTEGKRKYLGAFGTPEEAHDAYIEAKRRLHAGCTI